MTPILFLRRGITLSSMMNSHSLSSLCSMCSKASKVLDNVIESTQNNSANSDSTLHLSPLFSHSKSHLEGEYYKIELVDAETWRVSSGLAEAWRGRDGAMEAKGMFVEAIDEVGSYSPPSKDDPDFDEIEDMRIRGNLFYKLDKDSKEFEEYNLDFHRKKSSKNKDDQKENKKEKSNRKLGSGAEKSSKKTDEWKGNENKENLYSNEIDKRRIRGNLLYKLDTDLKEFEEDNFDFHGRKSSNDKKENSNLYSTFEVKKSSKKRDEWKVKENKEHLSYSLGDSSLIGKEEDEWRGKKNKENPSYSPGFQSETVPKFAKYDYLSSQFHETDSYFVGKKVRTPTFNQITAPYHEPFCLDIYISKASVRACIVHRATSKVVAVAHTISKDMKFDLVSTKNVIACNAVGEVLAQRALADDIYNVIYTPRKGERLEGKLQIVLQSIIDNGVNVKVKLKQRKVKKGAHSSTA